MSKHGYEVHSRGQAGWFVGVCEGKRFEPIEKSRAMSDAIVVSVRAQVGELLMRAGDLRAGRVKPLQARSGKWIVQPKGTRRAPEYELVPFDAAPAHLQDQAITSEIHEAEARARMGQRFADFLAKTADQFQGLPLTEAPPSHRPAPIPKGERRRTWRGVLTALYQHGATVHWESESGVQSRMSTRSWRLLPLAPAASAAAEPASPSTSSTSHLSTSPGVSA